MSRPSTATCSVEIADCSSLIETDMVTSNPKASPSVIPMGHFAAVWDVASAAVMLAMNDHITGQTTAVNGGWYMTS